MSVEPPSTRVEDRERETALVVALDARAAEADVVLLGLLRVEGDAARPCARAAALRVQALRSGRRRERAWPRARRTIASCSRLPAAATTICGGTIARVVVGGDVGVAERRRSPRRGRSPAARADARRRSPSREHVVDLVLRLVLVHRDLLEHDLALRVHVGVGGAEKHVAPSRRTPRRGARRGNARTGPSFSLLVRGVDVGAEAVEDLRDLLGGQADRFP